MQIIVKPVLEPPYERSMILHCMVLVLVRYSSVILLVRRNKPSALFEFEAALTMG